MKVFKFGGASVKDAASVRNVVSVLQQVGATDTLIVVSAMGKTTNALEVVVKNYISQSGELESVLNDVKKYHFDIFNDLFPDSNHAAHQKVNALFNDLTDFLKSNKSSNYNYVYDQIVSFGELISSAILSYFLAESDIRNTWLDVRELIATDNNYRDATVDWDTTQRQIAVKISQYGTYVTQGFLGADDNNFTTTLGREGSDYTAAIFAYCLNVQSVTIWKDVPGVLNADPRYFENAQMLQQISYREAIELAFYGATVIHPKTLQPLQRKEIPLHVKSFVNPLLPGTTVAKGKDLIPSMPCFIVKKNQYLISLSSLDFSFIMEDHIAGVFALLHKYKMKVSLIQNSAISFSLCLEDKFDNFQKLRAELSKQFKVYYNENVSLYTIRHFTEEAAAEVTAGKTVMIKQASRETIQIVTKE